MLFQSTNGVDRYCSAILPSVVQNIALNYNQSMGPNFHSDVGLCPTYPITALSHIKLQCFWVCVDEDAQFTGLSSLDITSTTLVTSYVIVEHTYSKWI